MKLPLEGVCLLALVGFTALSAAAGTTPNPCAPRISGPNPVFVPYGGSISLNCTINCASEILDGGWETSIQKVGETRGNGWISTNLTDISEWMSSPQCFFLVSSGPRITTIDIVAYQAPKDVSIDLPPEVVVDNPYSLTCRAVNIAPKRYLKLSILRGNDTLRTETFPNDRTNASTSVAVTHDLTAHRRDNRVEYTCWAELDLRPNGGFFQESSHPRSVRIVGPPINVNISAEQTHIQEGKNFTLQCYAEGIPEPSLSWHLPINESTQASSNGSTVTIFFARVAHSGTYTCSAQNQYGISKANVDIHVEETKLSRWAIALIVMLVFAAVGAGFGIAYWKCHQRL